MSIKISRDGMRVVGKTRHMKKGKRSLRDVWCLTRTCRPMPECYPHLFRPSGYHQMLLPDHA
jgi:hypothetical protein